MEIIKAEVKSEKAKKESKALTTNCTNDTNIIINPTIYGGGEESWYRRALALTSGQSIIQNNSEAVTLL
ncbi:MAG: hypothetical protein IAE90_15315 [Ignavibacteria bacterium]|nr:hypothetical protein [Ignavibacteria bacterium]